MDSKIFKILSSLHAVGVTELHDISPVLSEIYGATENLDIVQVGIKGTEINSLLTRMHGENLIVLKNTPKFGLSNERSEYVWPNTMPCFAYITLQGSAMVDVERDKREAARLLESTMQTNQSVIDTNQATRQSLEFQRNAQIWSIILAALSTIFIVITVVQSANNKTDVNLNNIQVQMEEQNQTIQLLQKTLKEINNSIIDSKTDTVIIKQK